MNLGLLFTRNISLQNWLDLGLLDREKQIYEEHLKSQNLDTVYWFTYGPKDQILAQKLRIENRLDKNIIIKPMPAIFRGKLGTLLYSFLLPLVHRKTIKKIDLIKSNQIDGAWAGIICKKLFKNKLIIRTGYNMSIFIKDENRSKLFYLIIKTIERACYKHCDHAIVTSVFDQKYVIDNYRLAEKKISVIKNYIDTNKFKDIKQIRKNAYIFVGRLEKVKNLDNLIEAISKSKSELHIYGTGSLEDELKKLSISLHANVTFHGRIANNEIPAKLNQFKYFIQTSYHEGMPKTLIEAMACGCICIATDVKGNNEVVNHLKTGLLIEGTNTERIQAGLYKLQEINEKNILMVAAEFIKNQHTLIKFAEKESTIFNRLKPFF